VAFSYPILQHFVLKTIVPHLATTLYCKLFLAVAKNLMQLQIEHFLVPHLAATLYGDLFLVPHLALICMEMGFVPHLASSLY